MARADKIIESEGRIRDIGKAVTSAIDEQCTESGFEITYAEINYALSLILSRNLERGLKEERKD